MNELVCTETQTLMESLISRLTNVIDDLSTINDESYAAVNRIHDVREPNNKSACAITEPSPTTVAGKFEYLLERLGEVRLSSLRIKDGLEQIA